jgi:hypothetical protein
MNLKNVITPGTVAKHTHSKTIIAMTAVVSVLLLILVVVKIEPFIYGFVAPNSIKTNDINSLVRFLDLQKYGTINKDSQVYLADTTLGHNLERDISITFNSPKSESEVWGTFRSAGLNYDKDTNYLDKSYDGVDVLLDAEPSDENQKIIANSRGVENPNIKYKRYDLYFST